MTTPEERANQVEEQLDYRPGASESTQTEVREARSDNRAHIAQAIREAEAEAYERGRRDERERGAEPPIKRSGR